MGYLGRNPAIGTQKRLDSIESQFNGVLTTFDLRFNGQPTYPTLSASLIVSLGGVLQEPGEAYYASSDTIVFTEAPLAGTECWILLYSEYGAGIGSSQQGNLGAENLTLTGELRGPSSFVIDPATVGDDTGDVIIKGNLTVQGATTTINSTTLSIDDKNIVLADSASPTDALADGGGITLKGTTDKTITWVDGTDAWTSSERFSIPLGAEGTPSLTFTGDPNTGLYSPGADQVAISTNGTGRLFVDAIGNVGLGASNPASRLHLNGANSSIIIQASNATDGFESTRLINEVGNFYIQTQDNANTFVSNDYLITKDASGAATHQWRIANSEKMRIASDGNVGIGTSSPQAKLDVNGNIQIADNGSIISNAGNVTISADASNAAAASAINFNVDGLEAADINNAGYLRFSKTNFVNGGVCTQELDSVLSLGGGANAVNNGLNIALSGPDRVNQWGYLKRWNTTTLYGWNKTDDAHIWYTGSSSERVRIDSSGNVGIGTTDPSYKLHVNGGDIFTTNNILADVDSKVIIGSDPSTSGGRGVKLSDNGTGTDGFVVASRTTGAGRLWQGYGIASGASTETSFINANGTAYFAGNVGINTSAPVEQLSIGDQSSQTYLNKTGIGVYRPHSLGLQNGIFVYTDVGYNASANYKTAAFKAVGNSGYALAISTDAGNTGLGGTTTAHIDFSGGAYFANNVGINTSAPETNLSIHTSANWNFPTVFLRRNASNTANNIKFIAFGLQGDTYSETTPANSTFIGLNVDSAPTTGDTVLSENARLNLTSPGGVIIPVGNVGIGITSPSEKLDITGGIIRVANTTLPTSELDGAAYFGKITGGAEISHNGFVAFRTAAQERARIDSSGRLGLGTTNPEGTLNVQGGGTSPSLTYDTNDIANFDAGGVQFAVGINSSSPFGAFLQARDNANAARAITLNPAGGNVGIGTANPTDKLVVFGGATITDKLTLSSTTVPLQTRSILFLNTENDGNYYTDQSGVLVFDENFSADIVYGTGNYAPAQVFSSDGGGLLIKNEDGWGAILTSQNTRWASSQFERISIGMSFADAGVDLTDAKLAVNGAIYVKAEGLTNDRTEWRVRVSDTGADGNLEIQDYSGGSWATVVTLQANTGEVGIGTTNPASKLQIEYSGVLADETLRIGTSNNINVDRIYSIGWGNPNTTQTGMGTYSTTRGAFGRKGLGIHVNTTDEFTIKSSGWVNLFGVEGGTGKGYFAGNVGIGTTNPAEKLHVIGKAIISSDTATLSDNFTTLTVGERPAGDGYASLVFKHSADNFSCKLDARSESFAVWTSANLIPTARFEVNYGSATEYIALRPRGVNVLHALADGTNPKVGIGTTNPATLLHLSSATSTNPSTPTELRIQTTSNGATWSTTNPWGRISFYSSDLSGAGPKVHAAIDAVANSVGGNSNIFFRTSSDSADTLSDRMTITPTGVGIGTTSPSEFVELYKTSGSCNLRVTSGASSGNLAQNGTDTYLTNGANGPIQFWTNSADRARIDSSGNVGIGTTNPTEKLHVNGTLLTGVGSGGRCAVFGSGGAVAVTLNDGYGNANLCFNHTSGAADANGSAARIRAGVDGTVGNLEFFVVDNVSAGTTYALGVSNRPLILTTSSVDVGSTQLSLGFNVYGNTTISGSLSKGSGSFKIDHPLPEKSSTHHLVHSFVESPQADNIYRGRAALVDGVATINLDEEAGMTEGTFVLLNRDIQCFTSNESDWDAVRGSVEGNILTIECQNSSSTAVVSWLVIGERQDAHMYETEWTDENGRVIVEPLKEQPE